MFTSARSRGPRRLLAILVAAIAVPALGATTTAQAQSATLPPVGSTFNLAWSATGELTTDFGEVTVDFTGGLRIDVEANPDDPVNSVRTPVSGFHGGGMITLEQAAVDVEAENVLRLTETFPPTYEQVVTVSFTMTVDNHPKLAGAEPLVLTTKEPARLIGKLTQFPPKGDVYQLQNPVDLVLPDEPDNTIATLHKFPVKVGGV